MTARTICLCSSELPPEMLLKLRGQYRVISLPPDKTLATPVQCHPDMICAVIDNTVFFPRTYAEAYPGVIDEIAVCTGLDIILTDGPRSPRYPEDVSLNVTVLPGAVVCRIASAAPELLGYAEKSGRKIIPVKQGYAGCSCIVSGNAVLTSDAGMHRTLTHYGIDCAFVQNSGIHLPGYNVGFIGGCGGVHDSGTGSRSLYLTGSPDSVVGGTSIRDFAARHDLTLLPLAETALTDYGGLKFL